MKNIEYTPLPTQHIRALQQGEKDIHGNAPEVHISPGGGLPCRHCLDHISAGDKFLILSYKPFETTQPYAEQGPIFLHADPCMPYETRNKVPSMYEENERLILRGYGGDERIIYGTGKVVDVPNIESEALHIFQDKNVKFIHARSSTNNCFQFRINRIQN